MGCVVLCCVVGMVVPASRYFVYPVFRDGGYFMLLSEFQDMCFLFTFLEDYRKNPKTANPWMSLTLYDEFVQDKGLGLLRGDVAAQLTRQVRRSCCSSSCCPPRSIATTTYSLSLHKYDGSSLPW